MAQRERDKFNWEESWKQSIPWRGEQCRSNAKCGLGSSLSWKRDVGKMALHILTARCLLQPQALGAPRNSVLGHMGCWGPRPSAWKKVHRGSFLCKIILAPQMPNSQKLHPPGRHCGQKAGPGRSLDADQSADPTGRLLVVFWTNRVLKTRELGLCCITKATSAPRQVCWLSKYLVSPHQAGAPKGSGAALLELTR